jgi:dienelactone hydrolase
VRTSSVALVLAGVVTACSTTPVPLLEFRGVLAANETLVSVGTRPGITTRVLFTTPPGAPKGVFLFFPGGEGFLVSATGLYGGFRRELAATGYVVAVVDVPSDHSGGLGGQGELVERFRTSAGHTQDVRAIIEHVHARWPTAVYLMGHSMGAISATHLAASLGDRRLTGVVLLGSPSERGPNGSWPSIPDAAPHRVTVPVVIAHHRDDGCRGSTFATASRYPRLFSASPRVGFIEVNGGTSPSPNPCAGNNYHSFSGRRTQAMDAVVRWFHGEDVRRAAD